MPDGMKNEDPSQIMMPGFGTITMDAGSTDSTCCFGKSGRESMLLKYQISLSDTGEQIYESGWIEPAWL